MDIRACRDEDIADICAIYNHYIEHTSITFEEALLTPADMAARVSASQSHYPWLVCVDYGQVVGYAYASRWRERAAYRHTAEATVYLRHGMGGQGYGTSLYKALLAALKANAERPCHVVLGCIAIPNEASVALHESLGFQKVAHFPQVGRKFGQWLDVGYWQLTYD